MSTSYTLPQNAQLCLLRLSAIGDVCHATAMVQRIRKHRPDVAITWVIGKVEYQLLKGLEGVEFVVFDKKQGRAGVKALKAAIGHIKFDALCMMQVALRANWVSRVIKAKIRLGFDKARSKEGHSLFINRRVDKQAFPHVLEGFMAFADALGVPGDHQPHWHMPVAPSDYTQAHQLLTDLQEYVVLCPTASKAERNWLPERYAAVCDYLAGENIPVVLCGGPGELDRDMATAILAKTPHVSVNLVGQTSLKAQLAILDKARCVIAPDTGPAHMATTVGTPVVGLYAHSNPRRTGPYLSQQFVVSVYDECVIEQHGKTWDALPYGTRVKGAELMQKISVDAVIEAIGLALHTNETAVK